VDDAPAGSAVPPVTGSTSSPGWASPTEPLRIPPARGPGRGLLLVLFVLLTVAALVLGVMLLRGGLADAAGAAASAVIVSPIAGSVAGRDAPAPGDPRRNRHR
jgi:serine/threonine-protein kinase